MGLVVRGGLVADGVAAVLRRADVLVEDGVIVAVEPGLPEDGHQVEELPPGSIVCPGFIDAHVHAEPLLLAGMPVTGALAQGVTTLVVGQDGLSVIGAEKSTVDYLNQYVGAVNGVVASSPYRLDDVAMALRGRLAQHVAVLASHGTIRHNVAGTFARPLEADELRAAVRQVEQALALGAVGLSSGLEYLPGRYGDRAELAALAAPLAACDRPYVSHLRAYGDGVGDALAELVAVGAEAGSRVHASHLWGPVPAIERAYAEAEAAGVGLTHDMYAYRRSSTILAMLLLPAAVQDGGPGPTLARLADPATRAAILREPTFTEEYLSRVTLGNVPAGAAAAAGKSIVEAAARDGDAPGPWVLDLLRAGELQVGGHLDRPTFHDAQLRWIVDHDGHSVGSDGIYQGQHPHPRGFGAFARLAHHYTAAGPDGWARLARHAAANPADVYALRDRGRLLPGHAADLVVISPDGLIERATDDAPTRPAEGVRLVLVAGVPVFRDGAVLPARPGRVLTR
jgi:N-acyl-D-amino-acid deacylase